jgi:molybdate transport system substrate-binding protein
MIYINKLHKLTGSGRAVAVAKSWVYAGFASGVVFVTLERVALLLVVAFSAPSALAEELIVSAATSLTHAFTEIGKNYKQAHPGTKIVFNFAASGALLAQIAQGAPVDVFASADQETMDKAQVQKLIVSETRVNFANNNLVLVAPAASSLAVSKLADLNKQEVKRIAIGNPDTVPNGRYAREALQAAGLWETLTPKFIYTNDVRQSLSYVERGEVEAGFVFATDAEIEKDSVKVALKVDTPIPIVYPMAVVAGSQHASLAKAFSAYVTSPPGKAVMKRYGFASPE